MKHEKFQQKSCTKCHEVNYYKNIHPNGLCPACEENRRDRAWYNQQRENEIEVKKSLRKATHSNEVAIKRISTPGGLLFGGFYIYDRIMEQKP
ncbi:MAG: hypothetical protein KAS32_08930 [Candidatus Peribacteraceae bacterium]|nr:hypothetical protein [Candidatus Peribacteraceae bacterium]